ncbi:YitT family protein [Enorma phocaeensis]|uniref:YitT family protein n=1 Tax=Enorma phocaeensis TaxID=1871019 RepID=UPI00195BF6E1|nr:YitT family protein [Enorma phocaeensis]MBM6952510.1 YitT family protein [Enorma phocaeensis]
MVRRMDAKAIIKSQFVHDLPLVTAGCAVAALGIDAFMVPNGLAAGGVTGLATIIAALGSRAGVVLPVGIQTIVFNALLLLLAYRAGGARYALRTVVGFVLLGFFTDAFAPFVAPFVPDDLMLSALWGAIISGLGYGLVFRSGANTGGSDTVAQIISRKTSLPVGSTVMAIDVAVCVASAPVFSVGNALYAALSMVIMGYVVDMVVDGGNRRRAAFIVSERYEAIAQDIMRGMNRGATLIDAHGMWSGQDRPMLFVILGKREVTILKAIVAEHDERAIMVITDVNEAFGEGFKGLDV